MPYRTVEELQQCWNHGEQVRRRKEEGMDHTWSVAKEWAMSGEKNEQDCPVSLVGFLFLLGLYISSLASCMGGLYGAPRILQCIAQEKVIPILSFLGHGRGPNKTPVAAIFLTGLLTMAFVFIGQVNILAPIVTINFMLTYSTVDYSYFSVTMSYELQCSRRKVGRVSSRTPGPLQPLILDKSTSYGSNGTLLEFTKDMDQIFKPGHVDTADSTKIQDKEQKKFIKLKKSRKPAKQTLQDSFQLDLQQNQDRESKANTDVEATSTEPEARVGSDVLVASTEMDSRMSTDLEVTTTQPGSGLSQDRTDSPELTEQSDETEDLERTGDREQLVIDGHQSEADRDESNTKQKVPEFEIQSLSTSFYSKLCNHWVSFIGAIISIIIMFVIQWIYALANIGVAVLLYFYIGRVSPGLNPGAAANFSFFAWIRLLAATTFRKKPPQEQYVVTPTFAHVGMETTQLTQENADFASRGRFHHSSVISQGQFVNQFN
ncbi:solute carrier family 12 member 8 [Dendropsophus ebraccatus]|uniref:solute carrier family 12 member 8 n=1 Tax=Dendropsophus ebraccatus TaxID=150705 RepID=UPI003832272D